MYDEEWIVYFKYLEVLRRSGKTNMYGATPFLVEEFGLSSQEANKILLSWMENYDTLVNLYFKNEGEEE